LPLSFGCDRTAMWLDRILGSDSCLRGFRVSQGGVTGC